MDATTEQPEAASTDAPEAQEPTTKEPPTKPIDIVDAEVVDEGTYQVLDELKLCFLHIHVGLSTRKRAVIDKFISNFNAFLTDYQRGTSPLPVDTEAPVEVEKVIHRWPSRRTSLGVTIHTTDFLTEEQCKSFDEALYASFQAQPLVAWGRWHEGGMSLEMGIVTIPVDDAAKE